MKKLLLLLLLGFALSISLFYTGCMPKGPTISQKQQMLNECKKEETKKWILKKAKKYNIDITREDIDKKIQREEEKLRKDG